MFPSTVVVLACLFNTACAAHLRSQVINRFRNPVFFGRIDPIVATGGVSNHAHIVFGGGAFAPDMSAPDAALNAKCTTNQLEADKSNYWMPLPYFKAKNGSFFAVPPTGFHQVYYVFDPSPDDIKAYPRGLQIVAGNAMARSGKVVSGAGGHNIDPGRGPVNNYEIIGRESYNIFNNEDSGNLGMRINVYFPQCYNPDAGLTNFKENMKYATSEGLNNQGVSCASYGPNWIHVPQLNLEVYFDVHKFDGEWDPGSGDSPWIFAQGDPTGFGAHGDFIAGWEEEVLQDIIDNCNPPHLGTPEAGMDNCGVSTVVTDAEGGACTVASPVHEDIWGELPHLPGCNPSQDTDPATAQTNCDWEWSTKLESQETQFTDVKSEGWEYYGCFSDSYDFQKVLKQGKPNIATIQDCLKHCGDQQFAGLEYTKECRCDTSFTPSGANGLPSALCRSPCPGDPTQICGGPKLMSVYKKCEDSGCIDQSGPVATGQGPAIAGSGGRTVTQAVSDETVAQRGDTRVSSSRRLLKNKSR